MSSRSPSAAYSLTAFRSSRTAAASPRAAATRPRAKAADRCDPLPARRACDRYDVVRTRTRVLKSPLGDARIDELLEEGNGEHARASNLVQPLLEERCGKRWARHAQA